MFPFWTSPQLRMMELVMTTGAGRRAKLLTNNKPIARFLQARCPSGRPTDSVRALKRNARRNVKIHLS